MIHSVRYNKHSIPLKAMEAAFFVRGLLFLGKKYTCPCCGWHVRAFNDGNTFLKKRALSYCPRCNAKSRHRRIWLFLQNKTNLFTDTLSLFEVSPKVSFARRFSQISNIHYLGADIYFRPYISLKMDLTATALKAESFDAVLCVHVLEEIIEDRRAMQEIYRILKPGGWAVVSVPTDLDRPTFEDAGITTPKERKRAFGEPDHVRVYGFDLVDRLKESGFQVDLDLAKDIPMHTREKYGLRGDENIFFCKKPHRMN